MSKSELNFEFSGRTVLRGYVISRLEEPSGLFVWKTTPKSEMVGAFGEKNGFFKKIWMRRILRLQSMAKANKNQGMQGKKGLAELISRKAGKGGVSEKVNKV